MDLTNKLQDYLPHQQKGSQNFDSLLKEVGTLLDEIGMTIEDMKYYSDFDKIPDKLIGEYSQMFGMTFPRNMNTANKRLLIRDIMNIHKTNGTEKALKFLFNIVGLSIVIDYIWSIDPTSSNILAYQDNNLFPFTDTSTYSDWVKGATYNRTNFLPLDTAMGGDTNNVSQYYTSTITADSSKYYNGANSASLKVATDFTNNADSGIYGYSDTHMPSGTTAYSVSAWVWFPSGQSFRFGGRNSITGDNTTTTFTGTGAWQSVKVENISYDFSTNGYTGFQCYAVGTVGGASIDFWIDNIQVEPGATATSWSDTIKYYSPIQNVSNIHEYASDTITFGGGWNGGGGVAIADAVFDDFTSSLYRWNIDPNFTATSGNGTLSLTTLLDGTYKQYGILHDQSLNGYERASIYCDVNSFQDGFGVLVGGNYFKMYNNGGTQEIQVLTKTFKSGNNYPNVSHTFVPVNFSNNWRFEVNTDNTIDFYMDAVLVFSGVARTEDSVGFWTDATIGNTFYVNDFQMAYSVADYSWSTFNSSSTDTGAFTKGQDFTNKALLIYKQEAIISPPNINLPVTINFKGSGLYYDDGPYVTLKDSSNVIYDRLEIMGEDYPVAKRVTTQQAVKTPYIRITVTKEDYNLFTSNYTDPTTGKVYSYTDSERYKITQEVINYFMNQGRPANVVVTEISTPFALDDLITISLVDDGPTLTQTDAGWVYDGTVNYGMDTDRYILGENFSGFNFGNSNLTLNTNPPQVNVTRSYPAGTSGLQEYIPTRKNAQLSITVPSDATVRIYTSSSDRVSLAKGTFDKTIIASTTNVTNQVYNIQNVFAVMINISTPSSTGSIDLTVTGL